MEPGGFFARTAAVESSARWPQIVDNSSLTWDILLVPVLVIAVWFVRRRTTFGLRFAFTGENQSAARHAGIDTVKVTVLALLLSGAIAGAVGASLILGNETGRLGDGFAAGFGFEGIVVALVARNSPFGVLPASFLFAILESGGGLMETRVDVPIELVLITEGLVILFVAGGVLPIRQTSRSATSACNELWCRACDGELMGIFDTFWLARHYVPRRRSCTQPRERSSPSVPGSSTSGSKE